MRTSPFPDAVDLSGVDVLEDGIAPSYLLADDCAEQGPSEPQPPPDCDPGSSGCDTIPG